jgi:hypothetical protein
MRFQTAAAAACAAAVLLGCATRSSDVRPQAADGAEFGGWDCARLEAELDRTHRQATARAYKVDERIGNNVFAFSLGAMVFWPALLAMRPDGEDAAELARLKGRAQALQQAQRAAACPAPSEDMPAERITALPLHLGERLVYDERQRAGGAPTELALRLGALKREELDFSVEPSASRSAMVWRQDRFGNTLGPAGRGLLHWRRLLDPDLALGETASGELIAADDPELAAPVTAQLVSLGPQTIAGRRFEAAVLELRGGAPRDGEGGTRLTGVMVVDRTSGVLLRLELTCSNPAFAVWRRLVRVDAAPL